MHCPVCREPMIVLEYDAVEIDYCVSCEGIWLDAGELELLFGGADACEQFMNGGVPASDSKETRRRCPICRKPMTKAGTQGERPVTYDRCSRGDGLWFDRGELAEVLEHGALPMGGDRVARLLREMFSGPEA
jgi:uncharacterized protein